MSQTNHPPAASGTPPPPERVQGEILTAHAEPLSVAGFLRGLSAAQTLEPAGPGLGPAPATGPRYIVDGQAVNADGAPVQ